MVSSLNCIRTDRTITRASSREPAHASQLDRRPRTRVVSALNVSEARPSGRAGLIRIARVGNCSSRALAYARVLTFYMNQEQTTYDFSGKTKINRPVQGRL